MTDLPPMAPQPTTLPAAGWYPDVEVPGGQRWWDGTLWTDHRHAPAAVVQPYGPTAGQPYGPTTVQSYAPTTIQPYVPIQPYGSAPVGEPPLWLPWYGIPFGAAARRGWKKYATFDGRASLSEYWWWVLFTGLISLGGYLLLLVSIAITAATGGVGALLAVLVGIAYVGLAVALFIPSLAIAVRRLHDAGYSGLLYLLAFVPFGSIVVLVLLLMPSNPAGARYDRG